MILYNGNLGNIPEFDIEISDIHYTVEIPDRGAEEPFRSIPLPSECRCNKYSCSHCRMAFDVYFTSMIGSLFGNSSDKVCSIAFRHEYKFEESTLLGLGFPDLALRSAKIMREGGLTNIPWLSLSQLVVDKCIPRDQEEKWSVWSLLVTDSLSDDLREQFRRGELDSHEFDLDAVESLGVTGEIHLEHAFFTNFLWWRQHVERSLNRMSHRAKNLRNEFLAKGILGDNLVAIDMPQFKASPDNYH